MNTIERLNELEAKRHFKIRKLSTDGYVIQGDHVFAEIVNLGSGGRDIAELMVEAVNALPKLLAVVKAARDIHGLDETLDSDYALITALAVLEDG